MQTKISGLKLSPCELLNLQVAHTEREPKEFLTEISAETGAINKITLDAIFEEFRLKYGSEKKVTQDLCQEINNWPALKPFNLKIYDKLQRLCQRILSFEPLSFTQP